MLETFTLLHALMIVLATILEVGANLFLKLSDGFRRKGYGILSIAMILAAFSCLFVALEGLKAAVKAALIESGKYKEGIPKDSRFALYGYEWLQERWYQPEIISSIERLRPIAESIGSTMSQLAIAWAARNPNVSTVITGASRLSQLEENLGAIEILPRLNAEILEKIDEALEPILVMGN